MKVCFINVPNTFELVGNDPVIIKEQQGVYPPLGILYMAQYLLNTGRYDVSVIDAQCDDLSHAEVAERVKDINPDVVGLTAMTFTLVDCKMVIQEIRKRCNPVIVVGGPHTAIYPNESFNPEGLGADFVVVGEGEMTMDELCQDIATGKIHRGASISQRTYRQKNFIQNLDELPFAARELTPIKKYYSVLSEETPSSTAFTSRGCVTGDTKVNTVEGEIEISKLVGKKIGVYTYDPFTRNLFIADGINAQKTRVNAQLVRVTFDDTTFIDCTPDHKFLMFKNGNQTIDLREYPIEAQHLKHGMSVRAFREELCGPKNNQYTYVTWARRSRKRKNRLIMEYILGKTLKRTELVHHKNHNRLDDRVENLEYVSSHKEHMKHHPEFSERMRLNNPMKIKSVARKVSRYWSRRRKLQINHKVVSVKWLKEKQDVYCLEVPTTGWFFANKVLIKNCPFSCSFCDRPALGKGFRPQSPKRVIDEMEHCEKKLGIKDMFFYDDTFSVSMKRVMDICSEYNRRGLTIKWDIRTRVNVVNEDLLKAMHGANCTRIHFGVETAVPRVVKELQKGITADQVEKAFDMCHRIGIKTLAYFMMGNPTETLDDVKETLAMARRIKPDYMQMTILSPFPATTIYMRALKEGVVTGDPWREYAEKIHDSFRPPLWDAIYRRDELEKHLRWFYKSFYLQPNFVLDRIMEVRNFGQFKRYASAGISLLKMSFIPESKMKDYWRTRKSVDPSYEIKQETAVKI